MSKELIIESLRTEFKNNTIWGDSIYGWIYPLPTTIKGKIGERIFMDYFKGEGAVKNHTHEWDVTLDDKRVEVKFSMLNKTGLYKFLQIRPNDNYTHISFVTIQPHRCDIFVIPKDKVKNLKPQHSGERGLKETMYLGITPEEMYENYGDYMV